MNMNKYFLFGITIFLVSVNIIIADETKKINKSKKKRSVVITQTEASECKIIPLKSLSYSTIKSICKPMLSPTGTIGYLKERNSVIFFDFPGKLAKIAKIINKIDLPPVNIRITVDFLNSSTGRKDNLYGKVHYKGNRFPNNQVIIRNGKVIKPNKITFGGGITTTKGTRNTSQFIMTKSGHPARLWVGKRIVDPSWLQYRQLRPTYIISRRGGTIVVPGIDNEIVWSDIGSELYVTPTYLGNGKIDVEVYPVVTYLVDDPIEEDHKRKGKKRKKVRRKRQSVMVQDASTHLTLQSGRRVSMGGVIGSNKKFYKNLFGPNFLSRDESNSILDMYITATVVTPTGKEMKENNSNRENPRDFFRHR